MAAAGVHEHQQARRIQQHRHQQVHQPGSVQQPQAIDAGAGGGEDQAFVAAAACHLKQKRADQEVRHQDHFRRDGQQRVVVAAGQPDQHQRQLHRDVGQPQRRRWGVMAVLFAEHAWKCAVLCGQQGDFRRHDGPAEVGAAHGNDKTGGDDHVSPRANQFHHQHCHRRVAHVGQFAARHHAQRQQGDHQIHRQRRQYRQHGRAAHVLLIARARGNHHGAFHADKHPQGDQHGVLDLFPYRLAEGDPLEVQREHVLFKGDRRQNGEHPQRQQLGESGRKIDAGGGLHAAQHQGVHDPQQGGFGDQRLPGIAVTENNVAAAIGENAQCREHDHQIRDVGDYGAQPVTPGRAEAHQLAESLFGVGEDAAVQIRAQTRKQQHGKRQKQNADAGDPPTQQQRGGAGDLRHVLRQTEHAGAQHRAEHQSG